MADAVSKAGDRVIAAKQKIGRSWIADRPPTLMRVDVHERARMQAHNHDVRHDLVERGLRISKPQQASLRRSPRVPRARRAVRARGRTRGPPRRKTEPMDFADHRIARDADCGGDLAAGHAALDAALQLLDALRIPSPCRCAARSGTARRCRRDDRGIEQCGSGGRDRWRWNRRRRNSG